MQITVTIVTDCTSHFSGLCFHFCCPKMREFELVKDHIIKIHGRLEFQLHMFLTLALDRGLPCQESQSRYYIDSAP